ncbi:MAG: DNA primase [Candidatus Methanolliviera hydrocarbonicum]|uniref:DNA primase DnaG n=1 Tax=Candidatus Methanolliviera hydrocarbonicum TaxID=2491085 RepID=A0A520KUY8_9EURY|nr:MAG: DNA primase [Candidatus Methanolliviera hydrocarbonicum]
MGVDELETTKYIIQLETYADGVVERSDVVGAIFGQSEGLLNDSLDLRELQKTGRVGRIDVTISSKGGKSNGTVLIPSSLDKVETSILAAALETIDRVGPCIARMKVQKISDVRAEKRKQIVDGAKKILTSMFKDELLESEKIIESVRQAVRVEEISEYGEHRLPAGPHVKGSDAILIVEGRSDVLNLLRYGIKNTVAVEGTNVPPEITKISKEKTTTAFLDGDRGGELILRELLQVADIDFVAFVPEGKCVEDLSQKEVIKSLRDKLPREQALTVINAKRTKKNSTRPKKLAVRKEVTAEPTEEKAEKKTTEKKTTEKKTKVKEGKKVLSEYKKYAGELNETLSAKLLDDEDKVIKEVAVRDLVKELKDAKASIKAVIFDGVITQRILDISSDKGIKYLVGMKRGNIVKKPLSTKIFTADEV